MRVGFKNQTKPDSSIANISLSQSNHVHGDTEFALVGPSIFNVCKRPPPNYNVTFYISAQTDLHCVDEMIYG